MESPETRHNYAFYYDMQNLDSDCLAELCLTTEGYIGFPSRPVEFFYDMFAQNKKRKAKPDFGKEEFNVKNLDCEAGKVLVVSKST